MASREFSYAGKPWRVETSGGRQEVNRHRSISVVFICEATNTRIPGAVNPIVIDRMSAAQLSDAISRILARRDSAVLG